MELSSVAIEGLNLCGDSSRVGDRSFRNLVQITLDILVTKKNEDALKSDEDISTVDSATLKQAYAGLVTMILEAIKMDCDTSSIRKFGEHEKCNNQMEKVNKPTYLITLKTEEAGKTKGEDVQFSCTMEQLQDLVGKLKDACKSVEKAANN
ncbi:hypothetical protein pdam_00013534 [Pocillopora damicornis]|uniref:COMM domain-containing protein 3 n=1 Tax=Pocillopora damicornis TaxID=46731 RepID=A0A3M6TCR3_POCDA|nr:hypothetical protein pdam_00013534 [Pocillopora damicornis]